jgi:hypothetical protein
MRALQSVVHTGRRRALGWAIGTVSLVGVLCPAASAAVLTVGDHGTYATIQGAVDAALGAGSTEIRVEQGTYVEDVYISMSFVSDDLELTGGWNAIFTARTTDPSSTVIDGNASGDPAFTIRAAGGSVSVDGFTVTNGLEVNGGGFYLRPYGSTVVTVSNNRIVGNTARSTLPSGAGVFYWPESGAAAHLNLLGNFISGNTSENSGSGGASGGGVFLYVVDGSSFTATGNRITDNLCVAPSGTSYGCGAHLYHDSTATSEFSDNLIKGNRTTTAAGTDVEGAGGSLSMGVNGGGTLIARRNLWIDNRDVGSQEGYHVKFSTSADHALSVSDSVIAGGPTTGIGAWSYDTSTLRLTNLTVFDHPDLGILYRGFGVESTLFNTIIFGSSTLTDFSGTNVTVGSNLLGVDPLFASTWLWDCRLGAGSPALDSGDNAPPGGLGPSDADGNPRVLNGTVDIGAYEGVGVLFEDDFESGSTTGWSMVVP